MKKKSILLIGLIILMTSLFLSGCKDSRIKTIQFETNGGTMVEDILYLQGSEIGRLPTPAKNSNIFYGWYSDKNLTIEFKETKITQDYKLYAKWESCEGEIELKIVIGNDTYSKADFTNANVTTSSSGNGTVTHTLYINLKNAYTWSLTDEKMYIYFDNQLANYNNYHELVVLTKIPLLSMHDTIENFRKLSIMAEEINNWINK